MTHVITHARNGSAGRVLPSRTLKYFLGLLGGQHIVTYDCKSTACNLIRGGRFVILMSECVTLRLIGVVDSQKAGVWCSETEYYVLGDIKTMGGPERARKAHAESGATRQLFAGFHFVLGKNTLPSAVEGDVRSIIQDSAGTLHSEIPAPTAASDGKVALVPLRRWIWCVALDHFCLCLMGIVVGHLRREM